jgi:hypothetical protein
MPFIVRVEVTYGYVPMGAAGTVLGQQQADMAGFGAVPGPGPVFAMQSAKDIVGETVPGGESPTSGNFQTALNAAATDLQTRLTTANAVPGFTTGTLLALVQGWSTGNP